MHHRPQTYHTAQAGPELLISRPPPIERQITGVPMSVALVGSETQQSLLTIWQCLMM